MNNSNILTTIHLKLLCTDTRPKVNSQALILSKWQTPDWQFDAPLAWFLEFQVRPVGPVW